MSALSQTNDTINWIHTSSIFDEPAEMLWDEPEQMPEHKLTTIVKQSYFENIFASLDKFKTSKYNFQCTLVEIDGLDQPVLMKEWIGNNHEHLQYWVIANEDTDTNGWGAIYADENQFLIIGNLNACPFVLTSDFHFQNTDGCTFEEMDFPSFSVDHVVHWMKTNAIEYIWNPCH